ncbi:folylpolyglutamate synthase/dihydrofolate synthase family protein [Cytobacillus sp. IB215316]|uniref:bifunctional folylpolyglutamate synthase/dihydrofolate synthase n=1 Tax=Cytobacillus sp. IB215316 TaxID=3097354 RepID=UPI002A0C73B6|nr:folylpolyglutamate synthase/dihydrofolate synthase family protein [Cytobacillus sp. IB215316]MDX8359410.1 folylpolyglutamate synthase/dihydrofolate synthase family protein [Cytobacillus sp. IB215316]
MVVTYKEAIDWIHSRLRLGMKPGLKRMEWMMERLAHPEQHIKTIHVAGTNGKGSTVCYLRTILQEAGYNIGTFTSPYIEQFNERISINGVPIHDEEIVSLVNEIKPLAEQLEHTELGSPTEFEVITAMALVYFAKTKQVDLVIFETGLGGRLDSTNVIDPLFSIITNIGFDHTAILGETVEEIAYEKSGIIKPDSPVITSVEQEEALQVILAKAQSTNSQVYQYNLDFTIANYQSTKSGESFSIKTPFLTINDLNSKMKGAHQVKNAALAIMAAVYLKTHFSMTIEEVHIRDGIKNAFWAGRFESLMAEPMVIIDGAHNPEGVQALCKTLNDHFNDKKIHIIFSALADKHIGDMLNPLADIAERLTCTSFDFPRSLSARELYDQCSRSNKDYEEDWKVVINEKLNSIPKDDVLIITGSLYFISEVRLHILGCLS